MSTAGGYDQPGNCPQGQGNMAGHYDNPNYTGSYEQNLQQNSTVVSMQPPGGMPQVMTVQYVPETNVGLVCSILSIIFCWFGFGTLAALLTWKAQQQVYDQKYEHARHTMKMSWILFGVAVCTGIIFWVCFVYFIFGFLVYIDLSDNNNNNNS